MLTIYDIKDAGSILDFIDACITIRTMGITPDEYTCGDIYKIYITWCFENNKIPELEEKFHKYLKKYDGNELIKTFGGNKYYSRITLNQPTKKEYGVSKPLNTISNEDVRLETVAIYIQLDTSELNDGINLEQQITDIYAYCLSKKYDVRYTFCDIGDYEYYDQYDNLLWCINNKDVHNIDKIVVLNPEKIYKGFGNEVSDLIDALKDNNTELEFIDNYIEIPDKNYQLLNEYINNK